MPFGGVNPSIRVYDYDVLGRKILNYKQHYLPLDELYSSKNGPESHFSNEDSNRDEFLIDGDRSSRNSKFMKNPSSSRKKRDVIENNKPKKVGKKGRGTPKWVKSLKARQCLDDSGKTLCLPFNVPKNCTQSIWKKLKTAKIPPPACEDPSKSDIPEIVLGGTTEEPDKYPDLVADRNSSLKSLQENTDGSNIVSPDDKIDDTKLKDEKKIGAKELDDSLAAKWRYAFNASQDLNVTDMTPQQMYTVWNDMSNNYNGRKFSMFQQELFVLKQGYECNETCHAYIMCSIRHVVSKQINECIFEKGINLPTPWEYPAAEHTTAIDSDMDIPDIENNTPKSVLSDITANEGFPITPTKQDISDQTTIKNIGFSNVDDDYEMTTTSESQKTTPIVKADLNEGGNASDDEAVGGSGGVTAVVVLLLIVLFIAGAIILYRRKYHWRNRQSDEFLLTDSVFKYDGYSHVDQF